MMQRASGSRSWMRCIAVTPSIPGMNTSSTTTSGL